MSYLLLFLSFRRLSITSSWSGVSLARTISSFISRGVVPVPGWIWNRKWVFFSSFSLILWDLLREFSFLSLVSLQFVFIIWFSCSNCNAVKTGLLAFGSTELTCVGSCFFRLPLVFRGWSNSSLSKGLGNCGDTYRIKKWLSLSYKHQCIKTKSKLCITGKIGPNIKRKICIPCGI